MTQSTEAPPLVDSTKEPLYMRLNEIEKQLKDLKDERDQTLRMLVDDGDRIIRTESGYVEVKVIRRERLKANLELLEALAPETYAKVTKRTLDTTALKSVLRARDIDPNVAAQTIIVSFDAPYISFTEHDNITEEQQ